MKAFYAAIDEHIKEYENGTITISDDIEFSMRQTVKQITHYILSRYTTGQYEVMPDGTKRRKPFRNIGNAIVDIEWRAKNIDRKNIEGHATDGDYIFALIVNKELQLWMKNNNFGKTIDDYQRKKSEYGSVLLKKTETDDELIIEPVQWENTAVDPSDIVGGMKVERSTMTPLQLRKKAAVWTEQTDGQSSIDVVIAAAKRRKERKIDILDIEGEFEACVFDEDSENKDTDNTIAIYSVILAEVGNKKYLLHKTELKQSRFKHDKRKEVEQRDFGMGVWEEVTEPQIATNEAVIAEKDVMDIAGKVLIKTNKKNAPSAMTAANGEIIDLDGNEFFDAIQLTPASLPKWQGMIDAWFVNMQRDQSAFPGVTGEEGQAGQPFASLSLQAAQGGSIFNKRRDQDGYFLLELLTDEGWVLDYVVKQINEDHTLDASYSPKELELLDEAIRDYHKNAVSKDALLSDEFMQPGMPFGTTTEDREMVGAAVQTQLDKKGKNRTLKIPSGLITLAKIKQKMRFDITDEMSDDQRRLNALATALGQLPAGDPARGPLVQEMMEISGVSAASFPITGKAPAPIAPAKTKTPSRVQEVLPQGQQV